MKILGTNFKPIFLFLVFLFASNISFADSSVLIEKVCTNLNLKIEDCYLPLATEKVMPTDASKSIVVIPKLAEQEEEYFSLDSYILIVENGSGKIISRYFESSETNNWTSDAVKISSITIDTAPYILNSSTRAFGIRVQYYGPSRVNPYSEETISLFIQREDKIIQVLNRYSLVLENGEWDGMCEGNFWSHKKILIISKDSTKGFANILIKDKITNTITTPQNEDCIDKEINSTKNEILKFDGQKYKAAL